MKVFSLYPNIGYSGGVILIAANNLKEAQNLAEQDEYVEYYGDISNMKEVKELSADVDTPKVILSSWYIE